MNLNQIKNFFNSYLIVSLLKQFKTNNIMRTSNIVIGVYAILVIALLVGEVKCVIKAVNCNWEPIGKAEVLYTASALTGFGCITGYFEIKDN